MIRVVVVDDEPIAVRRMRQLLGKFDDVEVVGDAATAESAAKLVAALEPDLVLLDIEMPGRNGMQLAADLSDSARPPAIIFVTAFGSFALKAFEVAADHYLLKPVELAQLDGAISRVRRKIAERNLADRAGELEDVVARLRAVEGGGEQTDLHLWLPDARGRTRVPLAEIVWIEAERDYVHMHAADRSYFFRQRIGQLAIDLAPHGFVRVHRSVLVRERAIRHVANIGDRIYRIDLADGREVTSSRRFADVVRSICATTR